MILKNGHCNAEGTLREAGLSQTGQRVAVLTVMIRAEGPLSAGEILNRTDPGQKINRVTVYRILSSFRDSRIIRELPTDRGVKLYEMACRHNPAHPHFYCKSCRTTTCLQPVRLAKAARLLAGPEAFRIDDVQVHVTGICLQCNRRG
ncbi:MAG: Ferric uptake regulation protein [Syntrophaceae bacterium PtaB.Bin095]|jgi:Fur family ferric uptake transcriptional regulator|nr:MAG: Ferric uptake regulation protein [Syntrophaceae bacterium PtaB.Bin095]